ncbi:MAG: DUF2914 domain-containing protein [Elusimicrobiales bacterium]|nr:DUF2914 domain-containing protein [Elusimicrobiales bacterium]
MSKFAIAAVAVFFCAAAATTQNTAKPAKSKPATKQNKSASANPVVSGVKVWQMVAASGDAAKPYIGSFSDAHPKPTYLPAGKTKFPAYTDVCCFLKFSGPLYAKVTLIWYADGIKVADHTLQSIYEPMMLSIGTVPAGSLRPGKWKVEARDSNGIVLATTKFTVVK